MTDYTKSRIYQIVDLSNSNVYIGSTTRTLAERLCGHVAGYNHYKKGLTNYVSSFKIIENGNYRIELIERYSCNSRSDLNAREGHHIRQRECINRYIAGRDIKGWRNDHKDHISVYNKKYYVDNTEKIKQHQNRKNDCPCGGKYTNRNKQSHLKSKKHIKYIS